MQAYAYCAGHDGFNKWQYRNRVKNKRLTIPYFHYQWLRSYLYLHCHNIFLSFPVCLVTTHIDPLWFDFLVKLWYNRLPTFKHDLYTVECQRKYLHEIWKSVNQAWISRFFYWSYSMLCHNINMWYWWQSDVSVRNFLKVSVWAHDKIWFILKLNSKKISVKRKLIAINCLSVIRQ